MVNFQSNSVAKQVTGIGKNAYKEGQFHVIELTMNNQLKAFDINLNVQNINGMTPLYGY